MRRTIRVVAAVLTMAALACPIGPRAAAGAEGASVLLSASDGIHGQELWRSDATEAGTSSGFQFPLTVPWNVTVGCGFGDLNSCGLNGYHLGEDVVAPADTPVYAPAAGVVKHTRVRTSYGNVVIIEHQVGAETVTSVLGHLGPDLQVENGQDVIKGQLVGYLGTHAENGGWTPHIHFAINKGPFEDIASGCGKEWEYSGYTTCSWILQDWYPPSDFVSSHGVSGPAPYAGDWNGDGLDGVGTYDPATATFTFRSSSGLTERCDQRFGMANEIPVVGDWNGDGLDTVGIYRASEATFYLSNDASTCGPLGAVPPTFTFGLASTDRVPVIGDWDGDGRDNVGLFRPADSEAGGVARFHLGPDADSPSYLVKVAFGTSQDLPVVGDWDADGDNDIGVYRPTDPAYGGNAAAYFDLDLTGGQGEMAGPVGNVGDRPIAGIWPGIGPGDKIGVYRPSTGQFFAPAAPLTPHRMEFLTDGTVKAGIDLDWGAAVSVLMRDGRNVLDSHDTGRMLQAAFYEGEGNIHCSNPTPGWNPVQGGSQQPLPLGTGSTVTLAKWEGAEFHTRTRMRDWNTQSDTDMLLDQWVSLVPGGLRLRYRAVHEGTTAHARSEQEFPAVYVSPTLARFLTYDRSAPWTGDSLHEVPIASFNTDNPCGNTYGTTSEGWISWADAGGWGVTLFRPDLEADWVARRFDDFGTNYMSIIPEFSVEAGDMTTATTYAFVGPIAEARDAIYDLHGDPACGVSTDDVTVVEGDAVNTPAKFTISLAASCPHSVTVDYTTADGTADSASDYFATSGTFTLATGGATQTVSVLVQGDTLHESNELFYLNLSNAVGGSIADGHGIATIIDDDGTPTLSIVTAISDTVVEGDPPATPRCSYFVWLSPQSTDTVTVDVSTADATATAGLDYVSDFRTIVIPPGQSWSSMFLSVLSDDEPEADEFFYINLSNAHNAPIGNGQATCTILDDDRTVPLESDLRLAKTDAPDPVVVGSALTYMLSVWNDGPDPAAEVTTTDPLPPGVTLVSASPSQGACSGTSVVTCSLGALDAGSSAVVELVVSPGAVGSASNAASVSSASADPNITNNTAEAATAVVATWNLFPTSATVRSGTLGNGTISNLNAQDAAFYKVNSTTAAGTKTAAWYGSFTGVSPGVQAMKVAYAGKNSLSSTQTITIWRWTDATWVQLDTRTVGSSVVLIQDLVPPGTLGDYVNPSTGEVRVQVSASNPSRAFTTAGDLLRLSVAQPVTSYTLIVSKAGTGTGTVTSDPSGIGCGTTCSAPFSVGSIVTLTASPAVGSMFSSWGGACLGTTTTCSVTMTASKSVTATFTAGAVVTVSDVAFSPTPVTVAQGSTVQWSFTGSANHNVVDNIGLFNSGLKAPGATFSFRYDWAGKFTYKNKLGTTFSGQVRVPLKASPASGSESTTFTVTWASAALPVGYVVDVQIKRPGTTSWAAWRTGETFTSATFTPDAGIGTYQFRARMRNTGNAAVSGWSAAKKITVS